MFLGGVSGPRLWRGAENPYCINVFTVCRSNLLVIAGKLMTYNLVMGKFVGAETVGDLFSPPPRTYGSRGEMILWERLKKRLANVALPSDARGLEQILVEAIEAEIGAKIHPYGLFDCCSHTRDDSCVYVEHFSDRERYRVVDVYWIERTTIPILVDRCHCVVEGENI